MKERSETEIGQASLANTVWRMRQSSSFIGPGQMNLL